ncbi:MAG: hypothetical protein J6P39_05545 [Oscillospiraceae bacterium]|nr:hypothetical protein [Oscillospiraceae bacterium]
MTSSQREAIDIMKRMDTVTVIPALVAQALGMNPDVLRKHARDGEYKISSYEVTGNTVRFFRKDFLQKIGEMDPDKPEKTTAQVLEEISDSLKWIGMIMLAQLSIGQQERLNELMTKVEARQCCNTDGP